MNGPRCYLDRQSSHRCIHPARLVTLVLFSSTLVASGMAQSSSGAIIPAIVVPLMFLLFCGGVVGMFCCFFCIAYANRNSASRVTTFNARERPTQQVIYPQTTPSAGGINPTQQVIYPQATPSAGGFQPYPVQSNYPQPVPSQPPYTEPQQVSLPEATLHQGDAPPGYAEAVGFATVNIDGQQTVTSATDK